MSHSTKPLPPRPQMPFQTFADAVWEAMGHTGYMTSGDWFGLSLEERQGLIAIWEQSEYRPKEATRLWLAKVTPGS